MLNSDTNGFLYAVNPDGTQRWRYEFAGLPSSTTPAIAADGGTIYVHMNGNEGNIAAPEKLFAINPNGSLKWQYVFNGGAASYTSQVQSSPVIGDDGTIYVASMDTGIYAIRPNGTVKWAWTITASSMNTSPAIGLDGTIYVKDPYRLVAFSPDGTSKWNISISVASGIADCSPVVAPDGKVYVADVGDIFARDLVSINPNGVINWRFTFGTRFSEPNTCPAVSVDGTVYYSSYNLYAVRPDGSLKWSFGPSTWEDSSPIQGSDGSIYWNARGCYSLNKDGVPKWNVATNVVHPAGGCFPSPAIGSDGTLYLSVTDPFHSTNQSLKAYFTEPLRITSIMRKTNDVSVYWTAVGGENYVLQASPNIGSGNPSNNFYDLSPVIPFPGTNAGMASYLDVGTVINTPSRYYRVRVIP